MDFGRLPDGPVRLLVTAVDGNGDDVTFDSHKGGIEVDHLLASAAFPIAFPPVSIDGRVYVDPGVSANLPIAPLFPHKDADKVLCLALDLVMTHGRVPKSLNDTVGRAQHLIFASQSRHALQRVIRSRNLNLPAKLAVLHFSYDGRDQGLAANPSTFRPAPSTDDGPREKQTAKWL